MLRKGKVPPAFVRRMRTINLLSATTLMKIEDKFLEPFDVMDLHHILDKLISQDAILDQMNSEELSYACTTGNLRPLWNKAPANPLLLRGFTSGWIPRFINEPFDPLCVMLAMRCKAMLDLVDQEGHSYNLTRKLGFGFIDFGEVPDEEPGDPGAYYPPEIDNPIDYPDIPTPPGPDPGEPGYIEPMPGEPGYIPPGPGDPGYMPGPGEPGYITPGTTPGTETGGGPGGGAPMGLGSGPSDLGGAASPGGGTTPEPGDPCADVDDPGATVTFSYTTQAMDGDETQEFSVTGMNPRWSYENYVWKISGGGGSLTRSGEGPPDPIYGPEEEDYDPDAVMRGFDVTYTAPATNTDCTKNPTIELWCNDVKMAEATIIIDGEWILKGHTCGLSGAGEVTFQTPNRCEMEKISGLKKQTQRCRGYINAANYGCYDPECKCGDICGEYGCNPCINMTAENIGYTGYCGDYCYYTHDVTDPCGGAGSRRYAYCVRVTALNYYEWECVPA